MVRIVSLLPLGLILAGCSGGDEAERQTPRDPQVAQALDDPLMTDPDLSSRNEGAAALTVEVDSGLPVLPATAEAIDAARAQAAKLVGGADKLVPAHEPTATGAVLEPGAGAARRLSQLIGGGNACADLLSSSAIWAARVPAALPVYPRGQTREAAGSDGKGCTVRTVVFATPVPRDEVMAFYVARAKAIGGEGPPLMLAGADWRLRGAAKRLAYDIYARSEGDHTLVRLTTIER